MAATDLGSLKTNIDSNVTNQTEDAVITPNILGAQLKAMAESAMNPAINTRTASYTLVLTDNGKYVRMNVAGANNLTVPLNSSVAFPVGTMILVRQVGAGTTTIVATGGVTLNAATLEMSQYAGATLVKVATNEWDVFLGAASEGGGGLTQLATPNLVLGTVDGLDIPWSWSAITGADGYELRRSETNDIGTSTVVYTGSTPSVTDVGGDYDTTYYYWLRALGDGVTYSDSEDDADSATTEEDTATPVEINFDTDDGSLVETSNVWEAPSPAAVGFGHLGLSALKLPNGVDGRIYMTKDSGHPAAQGIFGFSTTNALTGNATMLAAMYISGGTLRRIESGGEIDTTYTPTNPTYCSIHVVGTVITIETSSDLTTWTVRGTYTVTRPAADLFIVCDIAGNGVGQIPSPMGVNIV